MFYAATHLMCDVVFSDKLEIYYKFTERTTLIFNDYKLTAKEKSVPIF